MSVSGTPAYNQPEWPLWNLCKLAIIGEGVIVSLVFAGLNDLPGRWVP